jgi:hypothetical protein
MKKPVLLLEGNAAYGIAARASRFAELHSTKNGRRSPMRF